MAWSTISMQTAYEVEKFFSENETRDKVRLAFDGYCKCCIVMANATQSFINMLLKCFGIQRDPPVINESLK